jgi:hypothetical protein
MRLIRSLFLFTFAFPVCSAWALEPIDTDGPDFVESSEVVPTGHFQYELDMGSALESGNASQKALTSTPLLLKYGFAENFEVCIASDRVSCLGENLAGHQRCRLGAREGALVWRHRGDQAEPGGCIRNGLTKS